MTPYHTCDNDWYFWSRRLYIVVICLSWGTCPVPVVVVIVVVVVVVVVIVVEGRRGEEKG